MESALDGLDHEVGVDDMSMGREAVGKEVTLTHVQALAVRSEQAPC